jgi:hypothetical protein
VTPLPVLIYRGFLPINTAHQSVKKQRFRFVKLYHR